jgi:hypothetical protein
MYKVGGLAVRNMLLAADNMNVTVVFLKPSLRLAMEEAAYVAGNIADGRCDIVT